MIVRKKNILTYVLHIQIDQNDDGNTLMVRVTLCPHSVVFWKMAVVCDQKVVRWEDGENRILEVGGEGQNKEIVVWWNQK